MLEDIPTGLELIAALEASISEDAGRALEVGEVQEGAGLPGSDGFSQDSSASASTYMNIFLVIIGSLIVVYH
jgi:hypothetical protein